MKISSKTLNVEIEIHELTQGQAEQFSDLMKDKGELPAVKYEAEYVNAARAVGWCNGLITTPDTTRRLVHWIFAQLVNAWSEASSLPND